MFAIVHVDIQCTHTMISRYCLYIICPRRRGCDSQTAQSAKCHLRAKSLYAVLMLGHGSPLIVKESKIRLASKVFAIVACSLWSCIIIYCDCYYLIIIFLKIICTIAFVPYGNKGFSNVIRCWLAHCSCCNLRALDINLLFGQFNQPHHYNGRSYLNIDAHSSRPFPAE